MGQDHTKRCVASQPGACGEWGGCPCFRRGSGVVPRYYFANISPKKGIFGNFKGTRKRLKKFFSTETGDKSFHLPKRKKVYKVAPVGVNNVRRKDWKNRFQCKRNTWHTWSKHILQPPWYLIINGHRFSYADYQKQMLITSRFDFHARLH